MRSAWILMISKLKIVHSQQHVATINYLSGWWRNLRKIRILTRRTSLMRCRDMLGGGAHECFTTMWDFRLDQSASLAVEEADSSTQNNKSTFCHGSRMTGTVWHFHMHYVCSPGNIFRAICCRLTTAIAVGSTPMLDSSVWGRLWRLQSRGTLHPPLGTYRNKKSARMSWAVMGLYQKEDNAASANPTCVWSGD